MKINWIEYENTRSGMKIERILLHDLTLLVGLTGAGKTNILSIIRLFQNIILKKFTNEMLNSTLGIGIELDGKKCEWHIKFGGENIHVLAESFLVDGAVYFQRIDEIIEYNGGKIPNLSQTMSCVNIFENDDLVKKAAIGFHKINMYQIQINDSRELQPITSRRLNTIINSAKLTSQVLQGSRNTLLKLCVLHQTNKNAFQMIEKVYCSVFQSVEKLFVEENKETNTILLMQKERHVPNPISFQYLSAGMFKTLMLLTDIYSCSDGSVFLIDEFENSFGINCISDVTDIINSNTDKFQFIITSHHPYIINNIPIDYWSIVHRDGNLITAKSAEAFGIGTTKHDSFFELINIWDFEEDLS